MRKAIVTLLPILFFFGIVSLGARCESDFKEQDPEGYAKSMQEAREEGTPDPRR